MRWSLRILEGITDGGIGLACLYGFDDRSDAQALAAFWDQQILGSGLCNSLWRFGSHLVDEPQAARTGKTVT